MKPELFSQLISHYLLPSAPGPTVVRAMEIYADGELGAPALLNLLETNPAYAHFILMQKALSQKIALWSKEDPDRIDQEAFLTKRVLGLLGKTAVRNLIAAIRLARVSGTGLPRKKEDGFNVQVQQLIAQAIQTETLCQDRNWVYPEMGFVAGLHFDWLTAVLAVKKAPEDAKTTLRDAYQEGLWIAKHAYKISQSMKGVHYDRYILASALVVPIGKVLMAVSYPKGSSDVSWASVISDSDKYGKLNSDAALHFQKKNFGIIYPELSAIYIESMGLLHEVSSAIRFALEPWLLNPRHSNQVQLAMILSIATDLAHTLEFKPGAPLPLREFQRQWMKKTGLSEDVILKSLISLRADGKK